MTYKIDGVTENQGDLLLLNFENGKAIISSQGIISDDTATARPGGKFFMIQEN